MGGAPAVRKRVLMTPRGLVNRRNGAETALAGMADCAIRCDSSMVCRRVVAGRIDDDARLRRGDDFQQRLFGEAAEVFGVVNGIDGAAELGLTLHLIDPFDLAELFPRRGHQLLLLSLHDLRAQRGDGSVARIEIQFIQPGRRCRRRGRHVHGVPRCLPAAVDRRREQRVVRPPLASPATAHREFF